MPKFNMYQSLHTTVIGPSGQARRDADPHRRRCTAGRSTASRRTGSTRRTCAPAPTGRPRTAADSDMQWLRQLLDWQHEVEDPGEFLDSLRFEINSAEVFVFTPRGDVIGLPTGSTPVDFAYAIHTEVGHHTIGARVNGRLVPLESRLEHGDVVEVFTSKSPNAGPSRDWLTVRQVPAGPQQDPPLVHQGAPRGGHRAGQGADRPADAQGGPAAQAGDDPRVAHPGRQRAAARRRLRAVRRRRRGQPRRPDRRTQGHRGLRRRRGCGGGPRRGRHDHPSAAPDAPPGTTPASWSRARPTCS